MAVLTK